MGSLGRNISGPDFKLHVLQEKQWSNLQFPFCDKMHDLLLGKGSLKKIEIAVAFFFWLRAIYYLHTKLILLVSSNFLWDFLWVIVLGFFFWGGVAFLIIFLKVYGY